MWRPALPVMETKNSKNAMMALAANAAAEMIPMIHSPKLASCAAWTVLTHSAIALAGQVSSVQLIQPAHVSDGCIAQDAQDIYTTAVTPVYCADIALTYSWCETSDSADKAMA